MRIFINWPKKVWSDNKTGTLQAVAIALQKLLSNGGFPWLDALKSCKAVQICEATMRGPTVIQ